MQAFTIEVAQSLGSFVGQGLAALLEFDREIGLLCSAAFDIAFVHPFCICSILCTSCYSSPLVIWFSFLIMLASENLRHLYV